MLAKLFWIFSQFQQINVEVQKINRLVINTNY